MRKFFLDVCRLCGLKLLSLLLLFTSRTAIVYGDIKTQRVDACKAILDLTYQAVILETAGQALDMDYLWAYRSLLQRVYLGRTSDTPPYPEDAYECFEDIKQRFEDSKTTAQAVMKFSSFKEHLEQYKGDTKAVKDSLLFSRYFETLYALVLGNFAKMIPGDLKKISAVQKARNPFTQVIRTESGTDSRSEDSEEIKTNKKILLEEALFARVGNFDESDWKELAAMVSHVELPSDSWVFSHEFSHEFLQNIEMYRTQHPEVETLEDIDFCRAVSYFITRYHPTPEYPKIEAKIRQQQKKQAQGTTPLSPLNTTIIEIIAQKWLILEYTKQTDTELTLPEQDIRLLASTLYQVLHEKEGIPAEYFRPVLSEEFFDFLANLCEEKLKLKESAPASPQSSEESKNTPLKEPYMPQLYTMILAYYQEKFEDTSDAFGNISGRFDQLNKKFADRDSTKQSLLESALSCNVQALTECELDELIIFATNYSLEKNRFFSSPGDFSGEFATKFTKKLLEIATKYKDLSETAKKYEDLSKILPEESEKISQILGVFFTSYHTGMEHTKLVALQELQEASEEKEKDAASQEERHKERAKQEQERAEALSEALKGLEQLHQDISAYTQEQRNSIKKLRQKVAKLKQSISSNSDT